MPTKFALSALVALAALLGGCDSDRTTDFCQTLCECDPDENVGACTNECVQQFDSLGPSNTGGPIISDACFACVNQASCQSIPSVCNSECADLINALDDQQQAPQPGVPLDTN